MTSNESYRPFLGGGAPEKNELILGFIPLTDCAPLVAALEKGFFRQHGLEVKLSREASWASIRDKVMLGILDGAQMLAAMPLAATLGFGSLPKPMITAYSLDLNGNAITLSNSLYQRMLAADPKAMSERPIKACALKKVIEADKAAGKPPLNFGMVYPVSSHNYELRYWLAAAGIDPDNDVQLRVVPPPMMVDYLLQGELDGYCVGEPWNSRAVELGIGHTVITGYELWNNKPEKVLGLTAEWAEQYPNTHAALLRALSEASQWLDEPDNREEMAIILAADHYLNAPLEVVRMALSGKFRYGDGESSIEMRDFNVFYRYAAIYPWRSHAMWMLTQMYRWGQLDRAINLQQLVEQVYQPEVLRHALQEMDINLPREDNKCEGVHGAPWQLEGDKGTIVMGPDRFCDDKVFNPQQPIEYLQQQQIKHMRISLDELAVAQG